MEVGSVQLVDGPSSLVRAGYQNMSDYYSVNLANGPRPLIKAGYSYIPDYMFDKLWDSSETVDDSI